jgi:hypothetical protein
MSCSIGSAAPSLNTLQQLIKEGYRQERVGILLHDGRRIGVRYLVSEDAKGQSLPAVTLNDTINYLKDAGKTYAEQVLGKAFHLTKETNPNLKLDEENSFTNLCNDIAICTLKLYSITIEDVQQRLIKLSLRNIQRYIDRINLVAKSSIFLKLDLDKENTFYSKYDKHNVTPLQFKDLMNYGYSNDAAAIRTHSNLDPETILEVIALEAISCNLIYCIAKWDKKDKEDLKEFEIQQAQRFEKNQDEDIEAQASQSSSSLEAQASQSSSLSDYDSDDDITELPIPFFEKLNPFTIHISGFKGALEYKLSRRFDFKRGMYAYLFVHTHTNPNQQECICRSKEKDALPPPAIFAIRGTQRNPDLEGFKDSMIEIWDLHKGPGAKMIYNLFNEKTIQFLENLFRSFKGKVILTGHSMGGNMAIRLSLLRKIPNSILRVRCFSNPGMNEDLRMGARKLRKIPFNVTHFVHILDPLAHIGKCWYDTAVFVDSFTRSANHSFADVAYNFEGLIQEYHSSSLFLGKRQFVATCYGNRNSFENPEGDLIKHTKIPRCIYGFIDFMTTPNLISLCIDIRAFVQGYIYEIPSMIRLT